MCVAMNFSQPDVLEASIRRVPFLMIATIPHIQWCQLLSDYNQAFSFSHPNPATLLSSQSTRFSFAISSL